VRGGAYGDRERAPSFSQEFKRDAVKLVMEKGVPVRKIGRDINIHPNQYINGGGCSWQKALSVFIQLSTWYKNQGSSRPFPYFQRPTP
jgi:hypothetical protein